MNKMMRIGMSVVLVVGMLAGCAKAPAEGTTGNTEDTKSTVATKPAATTPAATKPNSTTTTKPGATKGTEATKPATTKGTEATKATEAPTTAPATNHTHSYSTYTVAADCWNGGYDVHTCSCGDSYTDNYTSALGHNYESRTVAPTATEQGYTLHVCTRCSESYSDNYVPATGGGSDAAEPTEHEHDLNPDGTCAIDGCTYRDEDVYQRWLENQKKHEEEEQNPYCPYCGLYKYSAEHREGCMRYLIDVECYICGEFVPANTCHHH